MVAVSTARPSTKGYRRSVSFGTEQVREYERQIDTSMYLGLRLGGWDYQDRPVTMIEGGASTSSKDKSTEDVVCSKKKQHERYSIYIQYGYTRKEISKAISLFTSSDSSANKDGYVGEKRCKLSQNDAPQCQNIKMFGRFSSFLKKKKMSAVTPAAA